MIGQSATGQYDHLIRPGRSAWGRRGFCGAAIVSTNAGSGKALCGRCVEVRAIANGERSRPPRRRLLEQVECGGCGTEVPIPVPDDWHVSKRGIPWCPRCPRHPGPPTDHDGPLCGRGTAAGHPCPQRVKRQGWPCYNHTPRSPGDWAEQTGRWDSVCLELKHWLGLRTELWEEDWDETQRIADEYTYGDIGLLRSIFYAAFVP